MTKDDPAFERDTSATGSQWLSSRDSHLIITHDDAQVYSRLIESDPTSLLRMPERFQLVIPTSEIVSANLFAPDV